MNMVFKPDRKAETELETKISSGRVFQSLNLDRQIIAFHEFIAIQKENCRILSHF